MRNLRQFEIGYENRSEGRRPDSIESMLFLFTVTWLAMLAVFLWGMYKMERQLNDEGQSLFYPWRVPSPKQKGLQVDNALRNAL